MIEKPIDLTSMSKRGRLIAEGIILRVRRKEIVHKSTDKPGITKLKLYHHLQTTIKKGDCIISVNEREGIKTFFDCCQHYFDEGTDRGECLNADCESVVYPLGFFSWLDDWCSKYPEDENCFLAIFDEFGCYPRYSVKQPVHRPFSTQTQEGRYEIDQAIRKLQRTYGRHRICVDGCLSVIDGLASDGQPLPIKTGRTRHCFEHHK